ncbi:MAG: hypothetical protein ACTSRK_14355 [Promethearchaeota archaeon]
MTDLQDLLQQYRYHLETYEVVCRKPPDLVIEAIHIHHLPDEIKKFDRKLGILIDEESLYLYEKFGNREFFMEFAALLSFIPDRFRGFSIIRRILFTILYPKHEQSIAKSSWLADKFHVVIRKFEQDLSSKSSATFLSEDSLYAFIKTVDIQKMLTELIPYLDSGVKKSEIIENLHYLFAPKFYFSYQMMVDTYKQEQIINEILSNSQKARALPRLIPMNNVFNFTHKYLNLSQFYVILHLNSAYVRNFQFLNDFQDILAEFPFFKGIQLSNFQFHFLCIFPKESIGKIYDFLHNLRQIKIVDNYSMDEINKRSIELKTTKKNLLGIRSQSISLEKNGKIEIRKEDHFFYDQPINLNPISPLGFFLGLYGRIFIPVISTLQSKKEFPIALQKAVKGYLRAHKVSIQPQFPTLYPLSSRALSQKTIMAYYQTVTKLKFLQFSPLDIIFSSQVYDSALFFVYFPHKSVIIEKYFTLYRCIETFPKPSDQDSSNICKYSIQFTWKDNLLGLAALSFEPFWSYFYSAIPIKANFYSSISNFFNFEKQEWDVSHLSLSEYKQNIVDLSKTVEIKENELYLKNNQIVDPNKYEMLASPTIIRKIIKKYRTLFHHLNIPNLKNDLTIKYLKDSLQAHHFLSSSEVQAYTKPLQYIEKKLIPMNAFLHPMLSDFKRIHVIINSRGLWLHPESLSSHKILRGLFTVGLVQCYYARGTQDGILLLEYLIPTAFYINPRSEFHRLLEKIKTIAKNDGNYSIRVLEIEGYALSINEWNLRAEGFKTKQFMKFRTSRGKKGQNVQNQNPTYNFHYNEMPSVEYSSNYSFIGSSFNPSTIPIEKRSELFAQNVIFNPVINWELLLFLRHSFYFFIWIKKIPQNDEKRAKIVYFFQQFPIVEIFTTTSDEFGKIDFYIIAHLKNNIYFLERKILNFFSEFNLAVQWHYLFPYEIVSHSPITRIMEISRQNPFQKFNANTNIGQFPILQHYQQNNCFSPEETIQIYDKYYSSPQDPQNLVDNINQIKKEFIG